MYVCMYVCKYICLYVYICICLFQCLWVGIKIMATKKERQQLIPVRAIYRPPFRCPAAPGPAALGLRAVAEVMPSRSR
jgi:hypothetical protein